jgi:flagellar FliJ protein
MRRFRFRLEPLLHIRKYREREWELKLAEITGICVRLEREIENMGRERARVFKNRYAGGRGNMQYIWAAELYMQRLDGEAREKQKELAEKNVVREKIRKQYLEVSKERKILDKLKERQEQRHYDEAVHEETKALDDMNSALFRGSTS